MAKRVFFSFHYQDVIDFRANVVRQHWLTKPDRESAGFFDASMWESAKKTGNLALKRLVNSAINGTSVCCVLIGSETYTRRWVRYEILKSFQKGNAILGVHINNIKGKDQNTKPKGLNPLESLGVTYSQDGLTATLWEKGSDRWRTYDEIEGEASYGVTAVPEQYRGKGFNLAQLYRQYDWVDDNGFDNFSTWVS